MELDPSDILRYEDSLIWVPIDDERAHPKFKNKLKESEMRMSLYEKRDVEQLQKSDLVRKMNILER